MKEDPALPSPVTMGDGASMTASSTTTDTLTFADAPTKTSGEQGVTVTTENNGLIKIPVQPKLEPG